MLEIRTEVAKSEKNNPNSYRKNYYEGDYKKVGLIMQEIKSYCLEKMPSLRTTLRIYFYDGVDSRAYLGINLETGEVFGYSGGHGPFDKMYVVELAQVNQPRFLDFQIALIDNWIYVKDKIIEESFLTEKLYNKIQNFKI